jgi:membrane peptidoglycan carboxypeptidase
MLAGRSRRAADADDRGDWTGRLSRTADDLKNRLGLRGSAAGRGAGALSDRTARWRAAGGAALAARGVRRAGGRHGDYVDQTGDNLMGGRTALRDHPDDFWADDPAGRGPRAGIAQRPGVRRHGAGGGGYGGGRGGGGRGGGWGPGRDPRSGGERFKDWLLYGSWWRHWTLKKALAVVAGGIAAVILLAIAGFFYLYGRTPIPRPTDFAQAQSSTVYYANGRPMGTFNPTTSNGTVIQRVLLTPSQIPKYMTEAMTAAEDRHFYQEGGVSVTGLMRAAFQDIFGSGNLQGGSTITMQYAKNYYAGVNTGQNLTTKLKEIFIAMKLGRTLSKPTVMTDYLNTVPFGPTIDGLGAAAQNYLSIDLTKPGNTLTISQAAMLASLPNAPGAFSPDPTAGEAYTGLKARWKSVLANMVKDNAITQAQANRQTFPKYNPPSAGNGETGPTAYLMNMVEQQLEAPAKYGGYGLSQTAIDTGGYRITTTFSPARMKALARSVSWAKGQMQQDAQAQGLKPFQNYDRIGAALENVKTGAIVAIYGGPGWPTSFGKRATKRCQQADCYLNAAEDAEQVGSSFKPYVLATAVKEGMSVFRSKLDGFAPIWIPQSPFDANTTEMTPSRTSPPPGVNPSDTVVYSNNMYWYKFAESGENTGVLPVNVAAAISSDPAFEDLAHRDGISAVINMAKAFGVGQTAFVNPCPSYGGSLVPQTIAACNDMTGYGFKNSFGWHPGHGLYNNFSPNSTDKGAKSASTLGSLQMALGQNPLTPIEQASTFATLANDGVYNMPHVIGKLLNSKGNAISSPLPPPTPVLNPVQAANVDWALSYDNNYSGPLGGPGTAQYSVSFGRGHVIAKTGTLGNGQNASEAWFIGATPKQYSMSVALFTNLQSQNLDNLPATGGQRTGSYGGAWPATIWNNFMTTEFSTTPLLPLFPTSDLNFMPWIQAHPKKAQNHCNPFQFGNGNGNGNGGGGGNCTCKKGPQNCGPNPNPSCPGQAFGLPCGGNTTGPSPTCQPFGQCNSPTPTPPVSPSPTSTCTPAPGTPCLGKATTAKVARKLIN